MKALYSMPLFMLFGWYDGDDIQGAKIFAVLSSEDEAAKILEKYRMSNVCGFQLQHIALDEEILPSEKSRVIYTVVRDNYGGPWRPATGADLWQPKAA